jgi:hypothetical protein
MKNNNIFNTIQIFKNIELFIAFKAFNLTKSINCKDRAKSPKISQRLEKNIF